MPLDRKLENQSRRLILTESQLERLVFELESESRTSWCRNQQWSGRWGSEVRLKVERLLKHETQRRVICSVGEGLRKNFRFMFTVNLSFIVEYFFYLNVRIVFVKLYVPRLSGMSFDLATFSKNKNNMQVICTKIW